MGWGGVDGVRAWEKLGYRGSGLENELGDQGVNGRQIGEVGEDVVGGKMKVEIREKLVNFRKLNICRETYLEYI